MVRRFALTLCLTLLPLATFAQEQDYTKPVLDKAIKAMGDADKQTEMKGVTCDAKTSFMLNNNQIDLSVSFSFQAADKHRGELTLQNNGQNTNLTVIVAEKKGWLVNPQTNKPSKLPDDAVGVLRADLHVLRLAQRPIALRANRYKLSHVGELALDNIQAVGLKVQQKDMPDIYLYFNKKTGLPVKAIVRVTEPGANEVEHSLLFKDYQEKDGIQFATKVTLIRDGNMTFEMEFSNVKMHRQIEKTQFEAP